MRKLLLWCLLCTSFPAFSQLRELRFSQLTVADGLPENYATCSLQDKFGYMWFGTQNGLARYDGYKLKMYNLESATGWAPVFRSVWSLIEDKDGSIWIGTIREGVFKFDRKTEKFVNYRHPETGTTSKNSDQIGKLVIDREGQLWCSVMTPALKYRLDRLDPKTGLFVSIDSVGGKIPSAIINTNILTKDSNFWVGGNHGLHRYDYATKKFNTIINTEVRNLYEAPSQPGVLWFIQKEGNKFLLTRYDTKSGAIEVFRHNQLIAGSIHSDTATMVYESKAGDLWVSTRNGISRFDRDHKTFKAYVPGNPFPQDSLANFCLDMRETKKGELWIKTSQKGLLFLSSPADSLKRYVHEEKTQNGLPSNVINSTSFIDRDGNFWVFTRRDGINRLDEKASQFEYVQKHNDPSGYPGGDMYSIANLDSDNVLMLTEKGLFQYSRKLNKYKAIEIPLAKAKNINFIDVNVDRAGIVWLCSGQGLFRYDPKSGNTKQYVHDPSDSNSLGNNLVRAVLEDSKGNFWIGTSGGGLNKMDRATGKFVHYPYSIDQSNLDNGVLDDDQVIYIYEDRKGVIWVGTNNGSLNRFDVSTGKFRSFYKKGDGFQCVISIFEDSKGRFWAGTYLWGLYLVDRETGKFRRWTENEGLAFDQVSYIKEDEKGRIWLASDRGFSILDGNDFSISHLNHSNGLPSNSFTSRYIYQLDEDWVVGTTGGFIRFRPGALVKSNVPPKVLIQSVAFNYGKTDSSILISDNEQLSFAYNENKLQFQFVGLHFSDPSLNQYQYKLEGYDKEWINAGTERTAVYTNLSPGKYRFLVKAANGDGVWSEQPASIEIMIHPPWWKTWWAYTLYALVFVFSVSAFIAYRSKKLLRENKVLEEKVEHRTTQLKQSIEELKTTQTQLVQAEKMASLGELTAGIAHEIQNPLNFINNFSEVSSELVDELKIEIDGGNTVEVKAIAEDLYKNLDKIVFHGKRADSIVKNMLQHSRQSSGQKEPTDINALVDEYLRLSYHGLRAKDKSFNALMETHFDPSIGKVSMMGQDVGRVLLNLFNNAFYSVMQKKKMQDNGYAPTLFVTTKKVGNKIEITVKDNGMGIPQKVLDKIYQPFFTTKPTGEGTGLGLSMSYDIITKGHGGSLKAHTKEGEYAQFEISLPA